MAQSDELYPDTAAGPSGSVSFHRACCGQIKSLICYVLRSRLNVLRRCSDGERSVLGMPSFLDVSRGETLYRWIKNNKKQNPIKTVRVLDHNFEWRVFFVKRFFTSKGAVEGSKMGRHPLLDELAFWRISCCFFAQSFWLVAECWTGADLVRFWERLSFWNFPKRAKRICWRLGRKGIFTNPTSC